MAIGKSGLMVSFVLMVLICGIAASFTITDANSHDASDPGALSLVEDDNRVSIISASSEINKIISSSVPNAQISDDISIESNLVIMQGSLISDDKAKMAIDCLDRLIPVIVIGSDFDALDNIMEKPVIASVDGTVAKGYVSIDGFVHTHSVICDDLEEATNYLATWIASFEEYENSSIINRLMSAGGTGGISSEQSVLDEISSGFIALDAFTDVNPSRGTDTVTCAVYPLTPVGESDYKYYSIHYLQNGSTNGHSDIRIGDLYLNTNMSVGKMMCAGPSSTSGTNTTTATVDLLVGTSFSTGSFIQGGAAYTWNYEIVDIPVVTDYTIYGSTAWHNVNETHNVGIACTVEPGVLVRSESDQSRVILDTVCSMRTYVRHDYMFFQTYDSEVTDTFNITIDINQDDVTFYQH
ncbi:MAG: hypothetical protein E7Z68_03010 [Thermoplasmata archaeon]|jgi:hypothetical protein|nr:hypothetical protein [Thermoplasmata archaeon]